MVDWGVPVVRWFAYGELPGVAQRSVDVSFIEPLVRRRVSNLGRMGLHVANECLQGTGHVRFVYASRHGELRRTTAILEAIARGEDVSPTAFSLSVLNATAGLYSIARTDPSPATAVASGAESFGYGLLEAVAQLAQHPQDQVLFVYADEPAPAPYDRFLPGDPPAHAVAVLLRSDAPAVIHCQLAPAQVDSQSSVPQSGAFLECLGEKCRSSWTGPTHTWLWSRHDG